MDLVLFEKQLWLTHVLSINSFVVMLVGVLFQLPSGLGNGGLFNFVQEGATGSSTTYSAGFSGEQFRRIKSSYPRLISTWIG